jgi:hypothetical protein
MLKVESSRNLANQSGEVEEVEVVEEVVAEVEEVLVVDMVLVGDLFRRHFKIIFQLISRVCLIKPAESPISINYLESTLYL